MIRALIRGACLSVLAAGVAIAQTVPAATDVTPPEVRSPSANDGPPNPSVAVPEILRRGDTIRPRSVDAPAFAIKPPNVDSELVIPAPGTPGGDRSVNPR